MGFYPRLFEGVADKYAEKEFNIPQEMQSQENSILYSDLIKEEKNKIIYRNREGWMIIKNPTSLKNFQPSVRAIISKEGDLYVSSVARVTHTMLLLALNEKRILTYRESAVDGSYKDTTWVSYPKEFAGIRRIENTNYFGVGESYYAMDPDLEEAVRVHYMLPEIEEAQAYFQDFFKLAKKKNPRFKFINKIMKYAYDDVPKRLLK